MPFFTLHLKPLSCHSVLKWHWVVACNRVKAVYNVPSVMRCLLFTHPAGSLIYTIYYNFTHPDFCVMWQAHTGYKEEHEETLGIFYKQFFHNLMYSHTDRHTLTHTHYFTHVENNDFTHWRTSGIRGIVQNEITAHPARSPRCTVLDKAGSCGGSTGSRVFVCMCVRTWGDVMSAGAGSAPP